MTTQIIILTALFTLAFCFGYFVSYVFDARLGSKLSDRIKRFRSDLAGILPPITAATSLSDAGLVSAVKGQLEVLEGLVSSNEKGRQSLMETQRVWIEALCRAMKINHQIGQNDVIGQAIMQLELYEQIRKDMLAVVEGRARTASMFGKVWKLLVDRDILSYAVKMPKPKRVNITRRIVNGKRETVSQAKKRLAKAQVTRQNRKAGRSVASYNGGRVRG